MKGRPPLNKTTALVLSPNADRSTTHSTPVTTAISGATTTGNSNVPAHEASSSASASAAHQAPASAVQMARGFEGVRGPPGQNRNMQRFDSSEMGRCWRPPGPRGPADADKFNAPFGNLNSRFPPPPPPNGFRYIPRGSGMLAGYSNGPNRAAFQRGSPMSTESLATASTSGPPPQAPYRKCAGSPIQSTRNSSSSSNNNNNEVANNNNANAWLPANPYSSSYASITAKRNAASGCGGICVLPARTVAFTRARSEAVPSPPNCQEPQLAPPPGLEPTRVGSVSENQSDSASNSGLTNGPSASTLRNTSADLIQMVDADASTQVVGVGDSKDERCESSQEQGTEGLKLNDADWQCEGKQQPQCLNAKEVEVAVTPLEVDVGSERNERRQSQHPSESDSGLVGSAPSTQRESAPDSPQTPADSCSAATTRTTCSTRTHSLADAAEAGHPCEPKNEKQAAKKANTSAAAGESKRKPSSAANQQREKSSSAPPSAAASVAGSGSGPASASASGSASGKGPNATDAAAAAAPAQPKSKSARRRAAHKLRAADRREPNTQSNDSAEYCSAHSSSPSPTHSAGHKASDR